MTDTYLFVALLGVLYVGIIYNVAALAVAVLRGHNPWKE